MAMREERPQVQPETVAPAQVQPVSVSVPGPVLSRPGVVRDSSSGLSSRPGSRPGSMLQLNTQVPPSKDLTSQLNLEVRPVQAPAPAPTPIPVSTVSSRDQYYKTNFAVIQLSKTYGKILMLNFRGTL